jgi:hypothetical protein
MLLSAQLNAIFSEAEIKEMSVTMQIIEDYPDDKYSPSSLVLGFTQGNRALHLQISRIESDVVRIITLYEPDVKQWIDYQRRKN